MENNFKKLVDDASSIIITDENVIKNVLQDMMNIPCKSLFSRHNQPTEAVENVIALNRIDGNATFGQLMSCADRFISSENSDTAKCQLCIDIASLQFGYDIGNEGAEGRRYRYDVLIDEDAHSALTISLFNRIEINALVKLLAKYETELGFPPFGLQSSLARTKRVLDNNDVGHESSVGEMLYWCYMTAPDPKDINFNINSFVSIDQFRAVYRILIVPMSAWSNSKLCSNNNFINILKEIINYD